MSTDRSHVREWQAFVRRRDPPRPGDSPLGVRIRRELAADGPLELGDLSARVDGHPARVERRCRELARTGDVRVIGRGRDDV